MGEEKRPTDNTSLPLFDGQAPASAEDLDGPSYIPLIKLLLAAAALSTALLAPPRGTAGILSLALSPVCVGLAVISFIASGQGLLTRWQTGVLLGRVEVLAYSLLAAVGGREHPIIFLGLLFSIFSHSHRSGGYEGLRAVVAGALIMLAVGARAGGGYDYAGCLWVLVFGMALACWGGEELVRRRRSALMNNLNRVSNPRFGVDRTIGSFANSLVDFLGADSCILIRTGQAGESYILQRAERGRPELVMRPSLMPSGIASRLLSLPKDCAVILRRRGECADVRVHGQITRPASKGVREVVEEVAELIETSSLMSVPLPFCFSKGGRMYLTSRRLRAFSAADLELACRAVEALRPVVENIHLLDQLSSDAADHERKRIARDMHDTTLQPYIGLRMGLSALRQRLETDPEGARAQLDELLKLTELELDELRRYVNSLREGECVETSLLIALGRFVKKFELSSGIIVDLRFDGEPRISDRLAAETFQLVAEGLSNIRRHTDSKRAVVRLSCRDGSLLVEMENESGGGVTDFRPKSISERAAALGGEARVLVGDGDLTLLRVSIPL
jgi:signal transduction histidine kinase